MIMSEELNQFKQLVEENEALKKENKALRMMNDPDAGTKSILCGEVTSLKSKLERAIECLESFLDMYVALVNSGDAGFWNPEEDEEVIKARTTLKEIKNAKEGE